MLHQTKPRAARGAMKNAIAASLNAETDAFKSRLDRAEAALQTPESPAAQNGGRGAPVAPPVPLVVRDSFTMPEGDYALISATQKRCLRRGVGVTKSEVLRAGLLALSRLNDADLAALVGDLEKVKTGRRALTG